MPMHRSWQGDTPLPTQRPLHQSNTVFPDVKNTPVTACDMRRFYPFFRTFPWYFPLDATRLAAKAGLLATFIDVCRSRTLCGNDMVWLRHHAGAWHHANSQGKENAGAAEEDSEFGGCEPGRRHRGHRRHRQIFEN